MSNWGISRVPFLCELAGTPTGVLSLSRGKEMDKDEILTKILLDILPERIKKNGKGREYFEKKMLKHWFPNLTEDEKVLVRLLTKEALDRAFRA